LKRILQGGKKVAQEVARDKKGTEQGFKKTNFLLEFFGKECKF